MKELFPLLTSFFVSCSASGTDMDVLSFPSDTVHIAEGHHVKLMKFDDKRIEEFLNEKMDTESELDYRKGIHSFSEHGVDLGMGNAPVIDQGAYGTCVTFSSTGVLNAIYNLGDGLSQQCFLELSKGLGNDIWNGAYYPSEVIEPIAQNGAVLKSACPRDYANPYSSLSVSQYKALIDKPSSEQISAVQYSYLAKASLTVVKSELDKGHRVLTGFMIKNVSEAVTGFNVKVDGKQYKGGLWACKQGSSPSYCGSSTAGHEVIIMGYDDDQKLLKIRNSWSDVVGEEGNYYMSYKFYESMAMDPDFGMELILAVKESTAEYPDGRDYH